VAVHEDQSGLSASAPMISEQVSPPPPDPKQPFWKSLLNFLRRES
jgi:hypothetical protein